MFGRRFRWQSFDIQHNGMDVHRGSSLVRWCGSLADTSDGLWNTMSGPIGMYERQTQALDVWSVESFVWCCMPFVIDVCGSRMNFRAHAPADVFPLSRRGVQKTPGAMLSQT